MGQTTPMPDHLRSINVIYIDLNAILCQDTEQPRNRFFMFGISEWHRQALLSSDEKNSSNQNHRPGSLSKPKHDEKSLLLLLAYMETDRGFLRQDKLTKGRNEVLSIEICSFDYCCSHRFTQWVSLRKYCGADLFPWTQRMLRRCLEKAEIRSTQLHIWDLYFLFLVGLSSESLYI